MCRNIRTLANFDPPATPEEVHNAALQFVRKLSGTTRPSKANAAAFEQAVDQISLVVQGLVENLTATQPPHNREAEAAKARQRAAARFS